MAKKFAVRNLRLCTKDCLCLYVCLSDGRQRYGKQRHRRR